MDARVEKILNLPAYQRMLIVLVVMVLIGVGFYFLVYQGQLEEHENLVKKKTSVENTLRKNQKIANNLELYKKEYEKLQTKLEEALGELPLKKEIPSLLTNIGALAKEKGLEILRFKPKGEAPKGFYAEVPVELKLRGSYHQAASFFAAVGNMERIVNIQNLKLGGAKTVAGRTDLSIDCHAITYRFVENPPPEPSKKKGGKK